MTWILWQIYCAYTTSDRILKIGQHLSKFFYGPRCRMMWLHDSEIFWRYTYSLRHNTKKVIQGKGTISVAFVRPSVRLSHAQRMIREPKGLACPNLEGRFPTVDATRISVSRSNGQQSELEAGGGILCRSPNPDGRTDTARRHRLRLCIA